MARVRVRQHVNPLSRSYQTSITPPEWSQIYAKPTQPLHLDIGSARGKFLLQMAQLHPQTNFLGVEIRESLVEEANLKSQQLGLTNICYLFGNINNSLETILESLPASILQTVTIQFPDPWFKQRHVKRRVVQPQLVETLANYLPSKGKVFIQSDIKEVAQEMKERFSSHPVFQKQHVTPWLSINPFSVPTEREKSTLAQGKPVYRVLFSKVSCA